jgi:hypothetical protein
MYTIVFFFKKKKRIALGDPAAFPCLFGLEINFTKSDSEVRTGLSEALIGGLHQIRTVIFEFSFDAVPWFRYIRKTKACMSRVIQEIKNAFHCEVKNSNFSAFFLPWTVVEL